MTEIVLKAEYRNIKGKQVKAIRRAGKLPAVMYGKQIEPVSIMLDFRQANPVLDKISQSTLVLLDLDGKQHYVLVRDKQRDVLRGHLTHVDFQVVSLTERVRANVAIHLEGKSPAVEELGGILVQNLEELDIEALPRDLPERINVDVSILKEIGDAIHVRNLALPEGIVVHTDPDEIIAVVTSPEAEEVVEELKEGVEPEVIERGKKEEE